MPVIILLALVANVLLIREARQYSNDLAARNDRRTIAARAARQADLRARRLASARPAIRPAGIVHNTQPIRRTR